jgi:hypothetical protein
MVGLQYLDPHTVVGTNEDFTTSISVPGLSNGLLGCEFTIQVLAGALVVTSPGISECGFTVPAFALTLFYLPPPARILTATTSTASHQ